MKIFKYIPVVTLSTFIIFIFYHYSNSNIRAFDTIATFLSITTGFTITALSIIATSPFSKNLYKEESNLNNSKSLLHELMDKFRTSMSLFIFTITLIVVLNLFPNDYQVAPIEVFGHNFDYYKLFMSTVLCFSILSLFSFIRLFNIFSKFVIKSAKSLK